MTTLNSKDPKDKLNQSIHQINGYVYVTDESEIKEGDWCVFVNEYIQRILKAINDNSETEMTKKVVYSNDPSLSLPVFEIQDEKSLIDRMAAAIRQVFRQTEMRKGDKRDEDEYEVNFMYPANNKAFQMLLKVNSEYKSFKSSPAKYYTEEDLRKAFIHGCAKGYLMPFNTDKEFDNYLQSLIPIIDSIDWEAEEVFVEKGSRDFEGLSSIVDSKFRVKLYPSNRVNAVKVNYR